MHFDLGVLTELCHELGYPASRVSTDELEVQVLPDACLVFVNLPGEDTLIGFKGTLWHEHGTVCLVRDDGNYAEVDELDVLQELSEGQILVIESRSKGVVTDRWLRHRADKLELKHLQLGEEILVRTAPGSRAGDPWVESKSA